VEATVRLIMGYTNIEWTDKSWNPTTGCDKISKGCKYCYADSLSAKLQNEKVRKFRNGFQLTQHDYVLRDPYLWVEPQLVFVNSMSDLFHEKVEIEFLKKVFKVMNETPRHTYQILTKRDERMLALQDQFTWSKNIWMGVSVENERVTKRIDALRRSVASVKFLSCEPLIGPLHNVNLSGIDWVIVGGESGPVCRPMKEDWVIDLRDQCKSSGVPFFFKQWGGKNKKAAGRLLQGKVYEEMPNSDCK